MYLLDTNVCIAFLRGNSPKVLEAMSRTVADNIALCSIVKAELLLGIYKYQESKGLAKQNMEAYQRFVGAFRSFDFGDNCVKEYAEIRADLERKGQSIGPNDTLIAAIARANDLTLVTHNMKEFRRVPSLKITDWQTE